VLPFYFLLELGKRLLANARSRWNDNIKIDFKEIGWEVVEWVHLAQEGEKWLALVNMVVNHRVHKMKGILD
jgi:hypothetical protein